MILSADQIIEDIKLKPILISGPEGGSEQFVFLLSVCQVTLMISNHVPQKHLIFDSFIPTPSTNTSDQHNRAEYDYNHNILIICQNM